MTDLARLDVPRPRPAALAASLVRRLDPWWGWVVAAVLLALAALVVGTLALVTVTPALGIADGTRAAQVTAAVCLLLAGVGAYVVFTRWRRARIGGKRALIRDGLLASATVVDGGRVLEKGRSDLELAITGGPTLRCAFNVWFGPAAGREIRVLWQPGAPTILAFDAAGRMYSGHVDHRDRAR
jgi:hypothetical protein